MGKIEKAKIAMLLLSLFLTMICVSTTKGDEEGPLYGGTLYIAIGTDPRGFAVWGGGAVRGSYQTQTSWNLYNRLLRMEPNYTYSGELAKSWEISDDHKSITFYLRQNVKWHDGMPFTSADVKFTFENLPDSAAAKTLLEKAGLTLIEAPDNYTVTFTFSLAIDSATMSTFAYWYLDSCIYPKHIWEDDVSDQNPAVFAPIGTGPFKFVEYKTNEHVIMEANPDYFLGRPYLNKLVFKIYPSPETALLALEGGEIDCILSHLGIRFEECPRIIADPKFTIQPILYHAMPRIFFNTNEEAVAEHPWLADIRVRKAIAYAIDYDTLIGDVLLNFTVRTWGPISNLNPEYYNPQCAELMPSYDPDEAERLLDEAGYPEGPDGIRLTIPCEVLGYALQDMTAPILKEMLRKVGINVALNIIESVSFLTEYYYAEAGLRDKPMAWAQGGGGVPDPMYIEALHHTKVGKTWGRYNMGFYSDPVVDELIEAAVAERLNMSRRIELLFEAQRLISESYYWIWVCNNVMLQVWNVEKYANTESYHFLEWWVQLDEVWWKDGYDLSPQTVREFIEDAEEKIAGFDSTFYDVSAALSSIEEARGALDAGDYAQAHQIAEEALDQVELRIWVYVAVVVVVIAIAILGIFLYIRRRRRR